MIKNKNRFLIVLSFLTLVGSVWAWNEINTAGAEPVRYEAHVRFLPVIAGYDRNRATATPTPQPSATPTMTPSPTATIDPTITPTPTPTAIPEANCRYGTAAAESSFGIVPTLGAGWVYKFSSPFYNASPANDAEKLHMIETFQRKTAQGVYLPEYYTKVPLDNTLADYIRENPGRLWIIGNEVDRGPQPGETVSGQGDMYPEIYAVAFHDVQAFIKSVDPTARIANAGLVEMTPGRLQYMDKVWNAYQNNYGGPMPVDVWTMHVYILPETNKNGEPNGIASVAVGTDPALGKRESGGNSNVCSDPDVYCFAEHDDVNIFAEQTADMRQWMKDHGQQQKPLIITEWSILYPNIDDGGSCFLQDEYGNCFTPQRVNNFMTATMNYLENAKSATVGYALDDNRLVQQWNWFSVYTELEGITSNLTEADRTTLTVIGENYRDHAHAQSLYVNLLVDNVPQANAAIGGGGTATADISVVFRNNGLTAVYSPFKVTFYKDAARTQVIDSVTITPELRGCATDYETATVQWPGLGEGQHQFWVHIDSENVIAEIPANQVDNLGTGFVQVNP